MRRALFGLVILGAVLAFAQWDDEGDCVRAGGRCRDTRMGRLVAAVTASASWGGAWFSFAMADAGYRGLDTSIELCSALVTVGSGYDGGFCFNGADAGMAPGSVITLTPTNGPTPQADAVCPNGPTCTAMTGQSQNRGATSNQSFTATDAGLNPPDDLSAFAVFRADDYPASFGMLLTKETGVAGSQTLNLGVDNLMRVYAQVGRAGTGGTPIYGPTGAPGALHVAWLRYHYIANGTSTLQACLDSACTTEVTNNVGPPGGGEAFPWKTTYSTASYGLKGVLYGVAVIPRTASVAEGQAIAHAVLADQPRGVTGDGDAGVAATVVRATVATCPLNLSTTNGALSVLPSGRPCVTLGGQLSERAGTELALRTDEMNNAAWVAFVDGGAVAPVRVADQAIGPRGTMTADRITFAATTTATQYSALAQSVLSAAAHSGRLYVLGQAGDAGTFDIGIETTGGGFVCAPVNYVSTGWRPFSLANVTSIASGKVAIGNLAGLCDGGTRAANDVLIAAVDIKAGPYCTTPVPATSASATRNATVVSFTPLVFAGTTHSIGASVTPEGLQSANTYFEVGTNANNYLRGYTDGTAFLCTSAINGAVTTATAPGAMAVGSAQRVSCVWDGGVTACLAGSCASVADAGTLWSGSGTVYVGTRNTTGSEADAVVGDLCDDALVRCSP